MPHAVAGRAYLPATLSFLHGGGWSAGGKLVWRMEGVQPQGLTGRDQVRCAFLPPPSHARALVLSTPVPCMQLSALLFFVARMRMRMRMLQQLNA